MTQASKGLERGLFYFETADLVDQRLQFGGKHIQTREVMPQSVASLYSPAGLVEMTLDRFSACVGGRSLEQRFNLFVYVTPPISRSWATPEEFDGLVMNELARGCSLRF